MRYVLIALTVLLSASSLVSPQEKGQSNDEGKALDAAKAAPTSNMALHLKGAVQLELVLIPNGGFIMGTDDPESPWFGGAVALSALIVVLLLIGVPIKRAVRHRARPQWSLAGLVAIVLGLGVVMYGGVRWWRAVEAQDAWLIDERPAHLVTLRNSFWMGKYEITQEQYEGITGANPSDFKDPKLPVEQVSWHDAQNFCRLASAFTGRVIRLPTEAEWEYACRAGTKSRLDQDCNESELGKIAWYGANLGSGSTHLVGSKKPNAWGLYDMLGNVSEWCADFHGDYGLWYKDGEARETSDPKGVPTGLYRVHRGGCFTSLGSQLRAAQRAALEPKMHGNSLGFRVVVETRSDDHCSLPPSYNSPPPAPKSP